MKIASSALQMESSHTRLQYHEVRESLRSWVGERRPGAESDARGEPARPQPAVDPVQISSAGKALQTSGSDSIEAARQAVDNDPKLSLIRSMIAMLTGREVKVFDAAELNSGTPPDGGAPPSAASAGNAGGDSTRQDAGYGIEYEYRESYSEMETTRFRASGSVRTEDGKEINFDLSLTMARSYHEESSVSIRIGDARQKKDPLVLNFAGTAAQLTDQRFKFDLDSDGKTEDINFVTGGSGFLAFDRNGDGRINDGSELFGARSGDGFAELAALDDDGNGWIDENDAAFDKLRLWSKDAAGEDRLLTLREANVGALSLARVATPFDLKDGGNALLGQIRASGVFLQEDGRAGTMQQVDLTV